MVVAVADNDTLELPAKRPGTDSATFGNTDGSVTVNLDGQSPSLAAVVFNGTGDYTLAQGSGGLNHERFGFVGATGMVPKHHGQSRQRLNQLAVTTGQIPARCGGCAMAASIWVAPT